MKIRNTRSWTRKVLFSSLVIAILVTFNQSGLVQAEQDAKSFYKGAMIKFIVPYGPGGGYDLYARMLTPYLEKYTGAKVIVENMAGAAGLLGGGHLYSLAKRDGLTIGIFPLPGMILADMLEFEAAKFELDKFTYVGRLEVGWRAFFVSKASGFKTVADMQKATKTIRFGNVDPTAQGAVEDALFAEAFGLNAKIIPGYKGSKEFMLAVIAGRELDAGMCTFTGYSDYAKRGEVTMLGVLGEGGRHPEFPDTPVYTEWTGVKPGGEKWLQLIDVLNAGGRAILAPPGVPEERRLFLENALAASLKEPELIGQLTKSDFLIHWLPGKECKKVVDKLMQIVPKAERPSLKHLVTEKYYK